MASALRGLRILVVEDILLIADSTSALLQDYGCEVVGPVAHLAKGLTSPAGAAHSTGPSWMLISRASFASRLRML